MTSENINELMEAADIAAANKALDEGWKFITVLSRAEEAVYVLGRHKETAREAIIRRTNAEKAEAAKKELW